MRVLSVQPKVLPGLVKGAKTLPKEVLAAGGAIAGSAIAAKTLLGAGVIVKSSGDDGDYGCGSVEASCIPLCTF